MRFKPCTDVALTVLLLLIAVSSATKQTVTLAQASSQSNNTSGSVSTSFKTGSNINLNTNKTSIESSLQAANTTSAPTDTMETAPSVTSVHQVWTSSSSGSVDELSPEMISKLRHDVPFLAAYALRPRLVGASVPSMVLPPLPSLGDGHVSDMSRPSLDTSSSDRSRVVVVKSGGNPVVKTSARQVALAESLVPKLGDFSEFNVETLSTSKSEHHHKRKTSLKRPPSGTNRAGIVSDSDVAGESSTLRRQTSSPAGKRKRSQSNGSRRGRSGLARGGSKLAKRRSVSKKGKLRFSKGRGSRSLASSALVTDGKLRPAGASLGVIKKGRYSQEASIDSNEAEKGKTNELDVDMQAKGRDTTNLVTVPDARAIKGGDDGVKGGPILGTKRPPFYAVAARGKQPTRGPETSTASDERNDEDDGNDKEASSAGEMDRGGKSRPSPGEQGNDVDEGEPEVGGGTSGSEPGDDEPVVEPKRVGDDDVEEDGDTVLIEPKSDGVDDDPPLPIEGDEEDGSGSKDGNAVESDERHSIPAQNDDEVDGESQSKDAGVPGIKTVPTGDARGTRSGRDRPNSFPETGSGSNGDAASTGGQAVSGGGGIGATIGGGGSKNEGGGNDDDDDDNRDSRDRKGTKQATGSPGVEFANEDDNNDDREGDDERPRSSKPRAENGDGDADGQGVRGEGDFGERRKGLDERQPNSNEGVNGDKTVSADDDLDYRDEMAETGRRSGDDQPRGGADRERKDKDRQAGDTMDDLDEQSVRKGLAGGNSDSKSDMGHKVVGGSSKEHCDDGSYSHNHEHHDEHHHHHDTIDWLRGSIPGEPDDDYPILSRVNTTNFKCSDQKFPGYYADVESRCQIFHICQADGRQDSFLCPNGTIFSQKTLVCVWWNGFNCEAICSCTVASSPVPETLATSLTQPLSTPNQQQHPITTPNNNNNNKNQHQADAPKFYHLNELLYKSSNGDDSPQAAASPNLTPLGRTKSHLKPIGMTMALGGEAASKDDESSIETLVKRMRGRTRPHEEASDAIGGNSRSSEGTRGEGPTTNGGKSFIGPDDEATIQRKSTHLDDISNSAPEASGSPSRIRARENKPRRKRRASTRQAPPKLKSRRVLRNSRRRKLRHGMKPRRRA